MTDILYSGWAPTTTQPTFPAISPERAARERVDQLRERARLARDDIQRKQTIHIPYDMCFYDINPCMADDVAYAVEIEKELEEAEEWLNVGLPEMLGKEQA